VGWYFPDPTGGTEVYVSGLVGELSAFGVSSTISAPHHAASSIDYVFDGVAVHRYPFTPNPELAVTRGEQPDGDFDAFVGWLRRQPRGIYHQHSWTTSCGSHHITAAKSLGFKTVLTVHVPANICLRGTMMEFGRDPCDGRVATARCAACWSQSRGLSRAAARALSRMPHPVSRAALRSGVAGSIVTALGARELSAAKQRQIAAMADAADRVVAVCGWLADVLRSNGVGGEKLVLSRQGVSRDFTRHARDRTCDSGRFRIGFLGRCDPVKGLHVLVEAVERLAADVAIDLEICAVDMNEGPEEYRDAILRAASRDRRIRIFPPVPHSEVGGFLSRIDALAVPSQWLETGPLVVLEALAAGTPVIGSDLGGIKELITNGRDGLLVRHDDVDAWRATLARLAADRTALASLRQGIRPVRTMVDAARDMATLYGDLSALGSDAA
jgi:glycosyltransferase involved in cell wall biosynthesis